MENPGNIKQQIVQKIKEASNVLVTVSANPSVDQLASTIGLTLLLNKLGKHGTAVFSGEIPSTIEFLEPEKTLEKDTNSLRDFIIALDKSKADKLRYKVEDKLVKIFITPYRTSLSDKDLEFSQGDFNVDVVIALGVKKREQLDKAIVAHGRILHDATVISINIDGDGDLGTMNWVDAQASSLSEMVVSLVELMQQADLLDGQMATAFLTGIVAETDRFSNAKTSSTTMSISSKLMAAGANQLLIADKLGGELEPPVAEVPRQQEQTSAQDVTAHNGTLSIEHPDMSTKTGSMPSDSVDEILLDEGGALIQNDQEIAGGTHSKGPAYTENALTAPSTSGNHAVLDSDTDSSMSLPDVDSPLLSHGQPDILKSQDSSSKLTNQPSAIEDYDDRTLTDLEQFVDSPHLDQDEINVPEPPSKAVTEHDTVTAARDAVNQAISAASDPTPEPIAALNAHPVNLDLGDKTATEMPPQTPTAETNTAKFDIPSQFISSSPPTDNTRSPISDATAPPPVPPPMMPPVFGSQLPDASPTGSDQNAPPTRV